ncbi:MAG: class I SAM-dependent methyltransferase [Pirellulales bacterium]
MKLTNKLIDFPIKIGRRVITRGPVDTARWLMSHIEETYQESKLNISTSTKVEIDELGFTSECVGYEPINYTCFNRILDNLEIRPDQEVFLDYGCGKGRAVVIAATRPFKRVLGLELSPELSESARENIDRAQKHLQCPNVEIVTANACKYTVPEDVSMIFLWNPFQGSILESVIERIRESAVKAPRKLQVIYVLPHGEPNAMQQIPWLSDQKQVHTNFWSGVDMNIIDVDCEMAAG